MTTNNLFANRATAKLAVDLEPVDTAITLETGTGVWFPAPGANQFFRLVVQKGSAQTDQREYMRCTGRTGDVLTVERAQEGTPAAEFKVGDEASLVVTALSLDGLVQRVGPTLQGALEVEAAPTTPLGIATKQYVEDVAIDDAPADGKDYARKDAVWHALGAAANLPVPIPIGMGGTGGISLSEAQLNLAIAKTTFDDVAPVAPRYGDRWIRPSSMTEMVWAPNAGGGGAGVWINPADAASQAYPIPIDKGGTGAITAPAALVNLGIPNHEKLSVSVNSSASLTSPTGSLYFSLNKPAGAFEAGVVGVRAGLNRWSLVLGSAAAESTGNVGSDFALWRYNDAGAGIDAPIVIPRATGLVQMSAGAYAGKLLLGDGTLAAPGLAFNSELGLGMYRAGTSQVYWAAQGAMVMNWEFGAANQTGVGLVPRAAGSSLISMLSAPGTNWSQLSLSMSADGIGRINTFKSGTGVSNGLELNPANGQVVVNAPSGVAAGLSLRAGVGASTALNLSKNGAATANNIWGMNFNQLRWVFQLGSEATESGGNAGSDLVINRYADNGDYLGSPLTINRANGLMATTNLNVNGALNVGGTLNTVASVSVGTSLGVGTSLYVAGTTQLVGAITSNNGLTIATANFPQMLINGLTGIVSGIQLTTAGANKYLRVNGSNNELEVVNSSNNGYVCRMTDSGNLGMQLGYFCKAGTGGGYQTSVFNFYYAGGPSGTRLYIDATDFGTITTTASDERIKHSIYPLEPALDDYAAIQPIRYKKVDRGVFVDDGKEYWGFSAQQLLGVNMAPAVIGSVTETREADGEVIPACLDTTAILAQTVLMVQDLIRRITQLENA